MEWMNARMELYQSVIVNHQQDDRVMWLPMAEFAANNGTSKTAKCTMLFPIQHQQKLNFLH
jgi:hypothetical protein